MQRGHGRGRRRYSLSSQNTSIRRSRSNPHSTPQELSASHNTCSHSRRAPLLLRRSARIAELPQITTAQQPLAFADPMADVARHPALGSRSVQPRHHNSTTRTSGRSRSGHHTSNIQYAMDFIVQPPRTARVGQTIPGTIIVRLRATNTDPDYAVTDSPNLMAVAALIPGPNSTASTDPHILNSLLAGQRIDSIHPFADDEADGSIASMDMAGSQGVGYMSFPNLVVHQPGSFRIRITLLRTADGTAVQVVDSNPIVVYPGGTSAGYASYNGKYAVASY